MAEYVDQEQPNADADYGVVLGDFGDDEYREGQSFQLSAELSVTAVEIKRFALTSGSPSGNWTIRIETDSGGLPSGTLADANASIVVVPPAEGAVVKGTFATPFTLAGSTLYHIVVQCDNQSTNVRWNLCYWWSSDEYTDGDWMYYYTGSWHKRTDGDLYFKVYVESGAVATGIMTTRSSYWGDI